MATKEEILNTFTFKDGAWLAYKEGVQVGYNEAFNSLRNQAAIAVMQAALSNQNLLEAIGQQGKKNGINSFENVLRFAISSARDLVEKLKEEE